MSEINPTPDIMEVTLRDGSYVIDFQFTAEDTATLVSALEGAGFRWIEIGHGLGLNARDTGQRRAAASDEEHLIAAAQAARKARWGMFFIPGIGRAEDIELAARYGMSFIRIGTNVNESERARPFIEQAKKLGMFVCYNAMKSYAVTPRYFADVARQTQAWGADMVYIVDSAGTMLPEDVAAFCHAIQDTCEVPIGFHGHDNLSMGMANTLQALESGAAIVDASLRGMGRSAGNVITEALLAIMQRRGHLHEIDLKATMDISAGLIAPLVPGRGLDTMAITAGYAGFHSSFTSKVQAFAERFEIDVRDLIVRLCEQNRVSAPDDLLEQLSHEIAQQQQPRRISIPAYQARLSEQQEQLTIPELLGRMYSEATKYRTYTALNIVISQTLDDRTAISAHIHNSATHTIGSVTISTEPQLVEVLNAVEGHVDLVLLDTDTRRIFGPQVAAMTAADILSRTMLLVYSDSRVWAEAVKDQLVGLLHQQMRGTKIVIDGNHPRSRLLALMLLDYGADVTIIADDEVPTHLQALASFSLAVYPDVRYVQVEQVAPYLQAARAVVVWHQGGAAFGKELAVHLRPGTYLIDAAIGSIDPQGLSIARERDALPIRINIWPTLSAALLAAHTSSRTAAAWGMINGVPVVSGGAIGEAGAVIVDQVAQPGRIIGVADGRGGLAAHANAYAEQIRVVTEAINSDRVKPQIPVSE